MPSRRLRNAGSAVAWAVFVAAASVTVAAGLRVLLGLVLSTDLSFTAMLPAVVVAALAGGLGAGLLAAILGGVVSQWAFVEPYFVLAVPSFRDAGNLIAYAILCILVLWAAGLYERARRRAESNAAAAARLASIVTNSTDAIIGFDRAGIVEDWNTGAERLFGYAAADIVGRPAGVLFGADGEPDAGGARRLLARDSAQFAAVCITRDGRRIDVAVATGPVRLADGTWIGVAAIVRDISREVASEQALRDANRHNILLLSEIHQRTRDTLQTVAGLIWTCAREVEDESARRRITALEQRVGAISRIHDQLHRSADFGTIEIGATLRQLVGDLVGIAGRPADMEIVGTTEVRLRSDLAVPLIFATTELVTNALTHAGSARPTVRVRCGRDDGALVIRVSDNGRGLPEGFEIGRGRGLGLRMATSALDQLGGVLRALPGTTGAAFEIRVPLTAEIDASPTAPSAAAG
ncbi:PAS domain S-box protein [Rhodoplanes sp. TEM]|uniref:histidine kinase n=1 Tax=Rhodoplanes tepidamans TaxID=200616 RepID=A0ABT5JF45_RHOTP|nr:MULTISPECIES: PAS domain S-box protein [Rhodoplanes]MDC7788182.1 PAS domain S-box protein [Rhodoplanes tepidamans]MDC7986509.1 PAS domain S-box protein [Rhodoplanes sp. TEM]MDQ0355128.1 PAS domain S-box-containing protein [Rhodoplanes tepidamans]